MYFEISHFLNGWEGPNLADVFCTGYPSIALAKHPFISVQLYLYTFTGHIDPENECPYIMIQIAVRPLMASGKVTMMAYYTNYIGLSANITN